MAIRTTAHIARSATASSPRTGFAAVAAELLAEEDPLLHGVLCAEHSRQESALDLRADANVIDPSVLSCLSSVTRDEPGTAIESLAVQRAQSLFGAAYAHARSSSRKAAIEGVRATLAPDARVLDVTGVAGQIVVGEHPNPLDLADVMVVGTDGQLAGPPGALILCTSTDIAERLERALDWHWSGAGSLASVAGIARALDLAQTDTYRDTIRHMLANAGHLAAALRALGYDCEPDRDAGHVVLVDLSTREQGAAFAAPALKEVNIVVETTRLPDRRPALRLGTGSVTHRQFGVSEIRQTAELVDTVLGAVRPDHDDYQLEEFSLTSAQYAVRRLLSQFPLPRYVPVNRWAVDHEFA